MHAPIISCLPPMVSRVLGGAIVRPCPSCTNPIIYPVITTLYLYSDISFSSMRKYICCIHVVSQPSFLLLLSLPPSLTPSRSPPSISSPLSLPPSLPPFLPSSFPGLVHSQLTFICLMSILKLAKLGKVPTFGKYCFSNCQIHSLHVVFWKYSYTFYFSQWSVELKQRDSVSYTP